MMWHDLEKTMQIFVASRFSMCEHVRAKKNSIVDFSEADVSCGGDNIDKLDHRHLLAPAAPQTVNIKEYVQRLWPESVTPPAGTPSCSSSTGAAAPVWPPPQTETTSTEKRNKTQEMFWSWYLLGGCSLHSVLPQGVKKLTAGPTANRWTSPDRVTTADPVFPTATEFPTEPFFTATGFPNTCSVVGPQFRTIPAAAATRTIDATAVGASRCSEASRAATATARPPDTAGCRAPSHVQDWPLW